jgi:hypothetical protein
MVGPMIDCKPALRSGEVGRRGHGLGWSGASQGCRQAHERASRYGAEEVEQKRPGGWLGAHTEMAMAH